MARSMPFEDGETPCQEGKIAFVEAILAVSDTKSVSMCPRRTFRRTSPSSTCPRRTAMVTKLSFVESISARSSNIDVLDVTFAVVDGGIADVDVSIDARDVS